jgi:hypothetical protein
LANSIFYASIADGLVLPVVDVRHPAFELCTTESDLAAMADQYVRETESRTQQTSPELVEALKRSRLGRGLMAASNGFLGGIETYMMKVGAENLPADVHPLDRAIAASFPALTTRLRLQDTAQLLAEGLARVLSAHPGRPIVCLNIGGGAGADSWNALLLLQAAHPELVADRAATIVVLDVDAAGAEFGGKAVEALKASGGPLSEMTWAFITRPTTGPTRASCQGSWHRYRRTRCAPYRRKEPCSSTERISRSSRTCALCASRPQPRPPSWARLRATAQPRALHAPRRG